MVKKRRLLRIVLILLAILVATLYFGFSTLFFSPLEGDYGGDVSTLIPRDVDFYVSKADLEDDLDSELRLRVAERFRGSPAGQALEKLPAYRSLVDSTTHEELLDGVREALAGLPIEVDPLTLFGGKDLALAGYFRGSTWAESDWAVYGRANWMGKLAVELLSYPDLLDLPARGITVSELDGCIGVTGGELQRPLYVTRVLDVVVVGTEAAMVARAGELENRAGEDSFGQSAKYHDHVAVRRRGTNELEVYVDYRALSEAWGLSGRWPDPSAEGFATAFAGKLFQRGSIRELIGTLGFGTVLSLETHGMLSSELMTSVQKRLYRRRGFSRDEVLSSEVSRLVPADVGLFFYGHGDVGDLLRQALASAEEALVLNLEDHVREVWGYADCQPLIDDFEAAFEDRLMFCVRSNRYPDEGPDGPPHDDTVVPIWALVLWVEDFERVLELRNMVHNKQGAFLIQGREPGSHGVYENTVLGGVRVFEYWSPMIAGTGHLSAGDDITAGKHVFIVSNHHMMIGDMLHAFRHGSEGGHPQLAEHPSFRTQVNAGLASADAILWLEPKNLSETLRAMARRLASDEVGIDWSVERPRIEKLVVEEEMPGSTWGRLSPSEQERLDMLAQPRLEAFEEEYRARHASRIFARYVDQLEALEALEVVLIELAIDQSRLDLLARVKAPLD